MKENLIQLFQKKGLIVDNCVETPEIEEYNCSVHIKIIVETNFRKRE